jgi:hypothetical protein
MEENSDSTRVHLIGPFGVAIETNWKVPANKGENADKLDGSVSKGAQSQGLV